MEAASLGDLDADGNIIFKYTLCYKPGGRGLSFP
jgi:hypothetical protein